MKRACGLGSDEVGFGPVLAVLPCLVLLQIRSDRIGSQFSNRYCKGRLLVRGRVVSKRVVSGRCWLAGRLYGPLVYDRFYMARNLDSSRYLASLGTLLLTSGHPPSRAQPRRRQVGGGRWTFSRPITHLSNGPAPARRNDRKHLGMVPQRPPEKPGIETATFLDPV